MDYAAEDVGAGGGNVGHTGRGSQWHVPVYHVAGFNTGLHVQQYCCPQWGAGTGGEVCFGGMAAIADVPEYSYHGEFLHPLVGAELECVANVFAQFAAVEFRQGDLPRPMGCGAGQVGEWERFVVAGFDIDADPFAVGALRWDAFRCQHGVLGDVGVCINRLD